MNARTSPIPPLLLACLLAACAGAGARHPAGSAAPVSSSSAPAGAGLSQAAAIEVCEPAGERVYLARLRCAGGAVPTFERAGSVGSRNTPGTPAEEESADQQLRDALEGKPIPPGQLDYHVVDLYEVVCPETTYRIFLDMYHCGQPAPAFAPEGFTLAAGRGLR